MNTERQISTVSKDLRIPDYNLIGIIKILNKRYMTDIEIDQNEQVITATEDDIAVLFLVASNITLQGYKKNFTKTFIHIDEALDLMGITKKELMESMDYLAAAGLQDHYIDEAGNMTVIQFQTRVSFQNQMQRQLKRDKVKRPNKAKRPKRRKRRK